MHCTHIGYYMACMGNLSYTECANSKRRLKTTPEIDSISLDDQNLHTSGIYIHIFYSYILG